MKEQLTFDPDSIKRELKAHMANGLRMIADAIQAGTIGGRVVGVGVHGLSAKLGEAHVLVSLDLSADFVTTRDAALQPPSKELA